MLRPPTWRSTGWGTFLLPPKALIPYTVFPGLLPAIALCSVYSCLCVGWRRLLSPALPLSPACAHRTHLSIPGNHSWSLALTSLLDAGPTRKQTVLKYRWKTLGPILQLFVRLQFHIISTATASISALMCRSTIFKYSTFHWILIPGRASTQRATEPDAQPTVTVHGPHGNHPWFTRFTAQGYITLVWCTNCHYEIRHWRHSLDCVRCRCLINRKRIMFLP